ncbi:MAG: 2-oxoacid:acceptor oxidoreductase subunit alpha [Planctomycetota bacterium]|jgi:2-oxoglutarate ferredoxin oxidoreductase subunit alpha
MSKSKVFKDDLSIVLCGQAGQGIQTVEFLLTRILKIAGFNVFATKEYMSRIRGGMNSTQIRVGTKPVNALLNRIDILIPLDKRAFDHLDKRISADTIVLCEEQNLSETFDRDSFFEVEFSSIAEDIGNKIYSNIVAVGTIAGLLGVEIATVTNYVKQHFSTKSKDIIEHNIEAASRGLEIGAKLVEDKRISVDMSPRNTEEQILLSGIEAVGLGAIAGDCNFISSYPMSPSTGLLVFLSKHSNGFDIIAEQAEDEIAAINMAIGAWYTGARGLVTTSGGGFALMTEGLSLAGMLESPIVIHLAQRPGPATGLPTRTEQGDLELVLYGGHGEFPRMILAPGTLEDAFHLTQKAFNIADKCQVPVFILTDQYFVDSYYNTGAFDLSEIENKNYIVKTSKDYRRYELTKDGLSPRGIPGYGEGLVSVDSDEHNLEGHITEDLDLRVKMVDKRLKKLEAVKVESVSPELVGAKDYKYLIVCWGSTFNIIKEAVEKIGNDDVALLHFKQVYPLPEGTAELLGRAEKCVIIEGNATGQFAKLIKLHTGFDFEHKILKYNGLSFSVEEVVEKVKKVFRLR